ncbi:putative zinc-binding metallopeptidase [Flavobacteriaceae bacterium]|nr:putative zinc-binding metallopeptidase [Flavobacteriaceae bacterium]
MKNISKIAFTLLLPILFFSCDSTESLTESQISIEPPIRSNLDVWLLDNFVEPYNIDIKYKFNESDNSVNRFLHAPLESNVMPFAELLRKVWIDPYNAVGGEDFIANLAPREFVFSGGFNYNPGNPTITLGFAEAGARITLFNLDFIDFTILDFGNNLISYVNPIKTVQHEYGHILNQNVRVDVNYGLITRTGYTGQWFDFSLDTARSLGYITRYARNNENDDFVEMVSEMLIRPRADYDAIINSIPSTQAQALLRQKEAMVVEYYLINFDIDFYALQELTSQAVIDLQQ